MARIDRYIASRFLLGATPVLLMLLALFGFIDLTEELEDVGIGAFRTSHAVQAALMSLPGMAIELAPISALLGTLIGLGAMASHHELTAMRAAGISLWRIALPVSVAVLLLVGAIGLLAFQVVPQLEARVAELHARTSFLASDGGGGNSRWIRSGSRFVRIGDVSRKRVLREVEIFDLGESGQLQSLIVAEKGEILGDGRWLLLNVKTSKAAPHSTMEQEMPRMFWDSHLSAAELGNLVAPVESLSPDDLYRYIALLQQNQLNVQRYRVLFWQKAALPVQLLGMALLGFPFVIGSMRSRSMAQRVAIGGGLGVLVYLCEQLTGHAAVLFNLNPPLAALLPDLFLLGVAVALIGRANGELRVYRTPRRDL